MKKHDKEGISMYYSILCSLLVMLVSVQIHAMDPMAIDISDSASNNNAKSPVQKYLEDPCIQQFELCGDIIAINELLQQPWLKHATVNDFDGEINEIIRDIAISLTNEKEQFIAQLEAIRNGSAKGYTVPDKLIFLIDTNATKCALLTSILNNKQQILSNSIANMNKDFVRETYQATMVSFSKIYANPDHMTTDRT